MEEEGAVHLGVDQESEVEQDSGKLMEEGEGSNRGSRRV